MVFPIISFLASKCITLKILNYTFIEFIIYALSIIEGCPNGLQIDIYLHYNFDMLEYYAKRLIAEKLFNSAQHTLIEYEHNKILLQGNGCVKSSIIKKK